METMELLANPIVAGQFRQLRGKMFMTSQLPLHFLPLVPTLGETCGNPRIVTQLCLINQTLNLLVKLLQLAGQFSLDCWLLAGCSFNFD